MDGYKYIYIYIYIQCKLQYIYIYIQNLASFAPQCWLALARQLYRDMTDNVCIHRKALSRAYHVWQVVCVCVCARVCVRVCQHSLNCTSLSYLNTHTRLVNNIVPRCKMPHRHFRHMPSTCLLFARAMKISKGYVLSSTAYWTVECNIVESLLLAMPGHASLSFSSTARPTL